MRSHVGSVDTARLSPALKLPNGRCDPKLIEGGAGVSGDSFRRRASILSVTLVLCVLVPLVILAMSREDCVFGHRPELTRFVGVEESFWQKRCTYELPSGAIETDVFNRVEWSQLSLIAGDAA